MAYKKITVSVPEEFVLYLDYLAKRLSVSRSSVLVQLAGEPIEDLYKLIAAVPDNPTEEDIKRAKGASVQLIEERVNHARSLSDDLFSD